MKKIKKVDIIPHYDYTVTVTFEDDTRVSFQRVRFARGNRMPNNSGVGMTLPEFEILLNSHRH